MQSVIIITNFVSSNSAQARCTRYNIMYQCNQWLSPLNLWVRIPPRRGLLDTTLCDKVCQWLVTGRWFPPGTPVPSTNKTDRHDIAEILLKLALNIIKQTNKLTILIPIKASSPPLMVTPSSKAKGSVSLACTTTLTPEVRLRKPYWFSKLTAIFTSETAEIIKIKKLTPKMATMTLKKMGIIGPSKRYRQGWSVVLTRWSHPHTSNDNLHNDLNIISTVGGVKLNGPHTHQT